MASTPDLESPTTNDSLSRLPTSAPSSPPSEPNDKTHEPARIDLTRVVYDAMVEEEARLEKLREDEERKRQKKLAAQRRKQEKEDPRAKEMRKEKLMSLIKKAQVGAFFS